MPRPFALVALLCASCGLDTFDVPVSGRTTVSGGLAGVALEAVPLQLDGLTTFDVKQSRAFRNQGAEPGDIDSMKLDSLALAVEAPAGATLDFMDRVVFSASAPDVPEVVIATVEVPDGATSARAKVAGAELKAYATAPSMTITSKVTGRQPREDVVVRVDLVLKVDVAVGPF